MTTAELIAITAECLEGKIQLYFDDSKGEHGDTLAKFIAEELAGTHDDTLTEQEQLSTAIGVLQTAADDLMSVIEALTRRMEA